MMLNQFDIRILDLHWIIHEDEQKDQCVHGAVHVRIGEKIVSDADSGDWTLSAAALNLMRTLDGSYTPGDFAGQLIPCCGFNMYAANGGDRVDICGCPNGIDWTIRHDGNLIKHISDTGEEASVDFVEYKETILLFADRVEHFYKSSKPKEIPSDIDDRRGVDAFWREWQTLKLKWS